MARIIKICAGRNRHLAGCVLVPVMGGIGCDDRRLRAQNGKAAYLTEGNHGTAC